MPLTEDAVQNMFVGRPIFHPSKVGAALAIRDDEGNFELISDIHYINTYVLGSTIQSHESLEFKFKAQRRTRFPVYLVYTGLDDKVVWWQERSYAVGHKDTVTVYVPEGQIFILT